MKYAGYFLIVWDFIRYAREHGIPVGPGRGSAAGSVVAYCLNITDVDPLHFDLIFERFLNPERISMPDIDIDFCERRRGEVIEYVTRKYGRQNVAQIITFGTMKARAVVRDVGRALDIPYADVDKVAKQIPAALDMTLDKALEENPALRDLESGDPRVKDLLEVARRLEGLSRHASVHAAGVVIAPRPITEFAPLHKGSRRRDHDAVGNEGDRADRPAQDGLPRLEHADPAPRRRGGDRADDGRGDRSRRAAGGRPEDVQLFAEGRTLGVFQFESSGMREILRKARPRRLEDLIALNALYRPGPLRGGMVDDYIARRHGRVEVTYELPQLEPVLRETYGVIAYQEQVMRIANEVGGFTLGQADLLRKAMGKKNPEVMQAQRQKFLEGARARKIDPKKAAALFDLMEKFAGYGFNKSHSTTYAWVAYQTAYLKANYPAHFMAALLTIESQNTPKLAMYLGECRELGVTVLPPDVNASELAFTVTPEGVRFGLGAVKNVGEGAVLALLDVRRREGRIQSLYELCEQLDSRQLNRRVLESLVKAGAMDSLVADSPALSGLPTPAVRARLFAAVEKALDHGNRTRRNREQGQSELFGGSEAAGAVLPIETELPEAPPWTEAQQLSGEKESLGIYWSGHPIERYADELRAIGARPIAELLADNDAGAEEENGTPQEATPRSFDATVGGIIVAVRPLKTRKGARMAAFTLDDPQGSLDVIVFPDAYEKAVSLVQTDSMVLVRGVFERDEDKAKLKANEMRADRSGAGAGGPGSVAVRLTMPPHDRTTVEAVLEALARHKGDRRVCLEVDLRGGAEPLRVRADLRARPVRPSAQLLADVERICGAGSVALR